MSQLIKLFSVLKFQDAYEKATKLGDRIFNSSDFDAIADFIETVSIYSDAKTAYPWLSLNDQQFIVFQLLNRVPTPNDAINLNGLDVEFPTQNNGILHIGDTEGAVNRAQISEQFRTNLNICLLI